ncbi:hypothetical protein KOI35_42650 [Actinoplanes bogorensis]|uniref:Uncharacterized protein n=1 Tax=Paractinoplanes bogorensis TaxID=1610840 RepID=A0ABS5Z3F3_9ACTN|nr:hypothetical protein [Actinoplanes bogorensis]MBU2670222.1 hypothetical protein [Actinoplanes bogorensis]
MPKVPGDLYIKYDAADLGTAEIPAGAAFWASPSIWLSDVDGNTLTRATTGKDTVINVQVDSVDADSRTGVKVQVWVSDFTQGGVGPQTGLASGGGAAGRITTIQGIVSKASPGVAHVTWQPTAADLINSPNPDEGHICVGANAFVENTPPPDGARVTGGVLNVIEDRHHGWKNITVVRSANKVGTFITFRMGDPGTENGEFEVTAEDIGAFGPLEAETLLAQGFVDLVDGAEVRPIPAACLREPRERTRLAQGGTLVLTGMPETTPLRPAERRAKFTLVTAEGRDQTLCMKAVPGAEVPVIFALEGNGEPGEVHVIDVVQRTTDGLVLGGARVIAVNVPEWHCC